MADEKKPEAKPEVKNDKATVFAEIVTLIIALIIFSAIFNSVTTKINSNRWFSAGLNGFIDGKSILLAHTRPIASLQNAIGAGVINMNKADVYDSPGGKKIGSHRMGARGKILQGPVEIGGKKYWYVDYDSGVDGWVDENNIAYVDTEPNALEKTLIWLFSMIGLIKILIIIFCILCFLYILYLDFKIKPILENERVLLYPVSVEEERANNPKWQRIEASADSLNENDWKIAIIEADIMLGDLLDKLSLPGDTIGDKLKVVERSDFRTLDDAWEAHKVRNRISHDGEGFVLNQRAAKIVIGLYRNVFEEFQII